MIFIILIDNKQQKMPLTDKFVNNDQNIAIVDEVLSLLSEKMNFDKTEALWKIYF